MPEVREVRAVAKFWKNFLWHLVGRPTGPLYVLVTYDWEDQPVVTVARSLDKLRPDIRAANVLGEIYWLTTVEA